MLAGSWLLAGWLVHGGLRRRESRSGVPRAVIVGHFTLALAGLGVWIAFVVTGAAAAAWAAVGVILSIAGLGMATLGGGLPDAASAGTGEPGPDGPAASGGTGQRAASARRTGPGQRRPGGAGPGRSASLGPAGPARTAVREAPARAGRPVTLIVVHGALAATTILLVVLAAIGAG